MNIDNINKTIALIEENNEIQFNMFQYVEVNTCGTAACLAGFANIAQYGDEKSIPASGQRWDGSFWTDHFAIARDWLELTEDEADQLFIPNETALRVTDRDIGLKVLKTFRDTGEVIWDELIPHESIHDDDED